MSQKVRVYKIEILNNQNPLNIQLPGMDKLVELDIEYFFYEPDKLQVDTPRHIRVAVDGVRRKFDQYGVPLQCLATIARKSGAFEYADTDEETENPYMGSNSQLVLTFIDPANKKNVVFDNNYLLNLNLYSVSQ